MDAFRRINVIFTDGGARGRGWKEDAGGRRGNEVGPTGREEGGWVEFGRLVRLRVGVEWGGERGLRGWWGGKCENGGWRGEIQCLSFFAF